ncbi:retrovirus-related Pol polyprotein from transposon opus [Caerostris extrusa]|uniref:Retrovirus-related Pol polyprotein from transposon opus n=1 Tax=Caerostris extrusa TaxID=172846 RepID=A0AAV4P0B7_CAEEX|nr:retrovirus-related Pol polyprotein from transposon opus [Caerostris extrusa]
MKNSQSKNTPVISQSNLAQASITTDDSEPEVLISRISIPASKFVDTQFKVAHLKITQVKCGNVVLNGVIDTGTQISIVRENLVADTPYDGERKKKNIFSIWRK